MTAPEYRIGVRKQLGGLWSVFVVEISETGYVHNPRTPAGANQYRTKEEALDGRQRIAKRAKEAGKKVRLVWA